MKKIIPHHENLQKHVDSLSLVDQPDWRPGILRLLLTPLSAAPFQNVFYSHTHGNSNSILSLVNTLIM